MAKFEVTYLTHYNGTTIVDAETTEEAFAKVEKWLKDDPADALQGSTLALAEATEAGRRVVPTYVVKRYFQKDGKKPRVIKRNLTLAQAKAHCQDNKTPGKDWFDGFEEEAAS